MWPRVLVRACRGIRSCRSWLLCVLSSTEGTSNYRKCIMMTASRAKILCSLPDALWQQTIMSKTSTTDQRKALSWRWRRRSLTAMGGWLSGRKIWVHVGRVLWHCASIFSMMIGSCRGIKRGSCRGAKQCMICRWRWGTRRTRVINCARSIWLPSGGCH